MRVLAASLVGNPLPEHIKVTVFMDGLKVGPSRTQLFRVHANTMEEAIQMTLQEEYSHRQARTPASVGPVRHQAQCKELQQLELAQGRYPWNWIRPYRAPSVMQAPPTPHQQAFTTIGFALGDAPPPPPPQTSDASMLTQLMQFMMHSQQQQQAQRREMMAQQMSLQQQLLSQQTQSRLPQKKKGDPPTFQGNASEDLELWIFSTEQYYAQHREEMNRNTSEFVDTIFANLGTIAQTWFRDFKLSLGAEQPATWDLFKIKIRERFRDRDFQQKVLTKLHDLRWQGSQQEYTTKFLHLLSQLDEELPEPVKRWMYQRNLRSETSSFISQDVPDTLQATIELAQRFEDSRPAQPGRKPDIKKETKPQNAAGDKVRGTQKQSEVKPTCEYCGKFGHTMDVCRARKRDAQTTGTIQDASVTTFVNSGASFNTINPHIAERLNLKVVECSKPLELTLGMNNKVLVPRRIVKVDIQLTGFPVYTTEAFVMAIPEQKHFLLGMPWLEEVNPEIYWSNQIIKSRDTHGVTSFHRQLRIYRTMIS
ncbi:Hypothetical protein PHPALM_10766 [Phytophthora palmivora]|uniref:Ty3 transposon capsid-like protein domain-containing protein n=1 Tax=Phytophthora palmivora TaxID=4796 RepID=A0A2P4Y3W5_9STRA|nr:Hypothetical protein PHPALM_10766 [Phytophthora palmivora]